MSDAQERAREALEEITFDRATGKLTDADYQALRARYEAELGSPPPTATATVVPGDRVPDDDPAEALIRRMRGDTRVCPSCGPRAEPDAAFCSHCGRFLGVCAACGVGDHPVGARYCRSCGGALRLPGV